VQFPQTESTYFLSFHFVFLECCFARFCAWIILIILSHYLENLNFYNNVCNKNVTCADNVFVFFHFVRYKRILTLKSYVNFLQHDLSCEKHSCHLCRLRLIVNHGYLLVGGCLLCGLWPHYPSVHSAHVNFSCKFRRKALFLWKHSWRSYM
jgi:hypothetical protein